MKSSGTWQDFAQMFGLFPISERNTKYPEGAQSTGSKSDSPLTTVPGGTTQWAKIYNSAAPETSERFQFYWLVDRDSDI